MDAANAHHLTRDEPRPVVYANHDVSCVVAEHSACSAWWRFVSTGTPLPATEVARQFQHEFSYIRYRVGWLVFSAAKSLHIGQ